MREEAVKALSGEPFQVRKGAEVMVMYSLDNSKHYLKKVESLGYPLKLLEFHSKDNDKIVMTVFSYKLGMRFVLAFNLDDIRLL
jgi:hypothetical protein